MTYSKPQIVAQNGGQGCFAAGCPEKDSCNGVTSGPKGCKACERTK